MKAPLICFVLSLLVSTTAYASNLAELERLVNDNLQLRIAELDYQRNTSRLREEQAKRGWKLYGALALSENDEITGPDSTRDYQELNGQIGLQYPLLGSGLREQEAVEHARTQQLESAFGIELRRTEIIKKLRLEYVDYWMTQKKWRLSQDLIGKEKSVRKALDRRRSTGLVLDADHKLTMSGFSFARAIATETNASQDTHLQRIGLLTGQPLAAFAADYPKVKEPCTDATKLEQTVALAHPEIAALGALIEERRNSPRLDDSYGLESHLRLSYSANKELDNHDTGHTAMVALNFQVPLDLNGIRSSSKDQAMAEQKKAKLELDLRTRELQLQARQALNHYQAQTDKLAYVRTVLSGHKENIRAQTLRLKALPGDMLGQFQQARLEYYKAALNEVDAEANLLRAKVKLNAFAPTGCAAVDQAPTEQQRPTLPAVKPSLLVSNSVSVSRKEPRKRLAKRDSHVQLQSKLPSPWDNTETALRDEHAESKLAIKEHKPLPREAAVEVVEITRPEPATGEMPFPWSSTTSDIKEQNFPLSVYLWDSEQMLADRDAAEAALDKFRTRNVKRLLLSLNPSQIDALSSRDKAAQLIAFIDTAKDDGIRTELLLGEPNWILPAQRNDLLSLIGRLKGLPFDGLHLDLEPNQLNEAKLGTEYLLSELTRTLAASKEASPWPVGLSIHPKYLDKAVDGKSFASRLEDAGVDEITLMVYVSDADRVERIVSPLIQQHSQLNFSVAQSLEDFLPAASSHAGVNTDKFKLKMDRLAGNLQQDNFKGIVVQSWRYFQQLPL